MGASSQGLPGVSENPETTPRIKVHGMSIILRGRQYTRLWLSIDVVEELLTDATWQILQNSTLNPTLQITSVSSQLNV